MRVVWRTEVLGPFARRFGLVLVLGDLPEPPPPLPRSSTTGVDAWSLYQAGELLPRRPLHQLVDAIFRRPAGAGLFYVWGRDRGEAANGATWAC